MLNSEEFINRLQELMAQKQLTASAFAARIGVQRSSVSHILAQRNKPSLEFVLKIHQAFDDIDLTWLLLGKTPLQKTIESQEYFKEDASLANPISQVPQTLKEEHSEIEAIVTLYKDGRFKKYLPKS